MIPVLGVDQSMTSTGLALVLEGGVRTRLVVTGPPAAPGLAGVRSRVRYIVGRTLQFLGDADLAPGRMVLTVIEAPLITRRHQSGQILERAWLFGMLVDQLAMRGPVAQVRSSTRAKYATGNGKAEKPEVLAAMRAEHPAVPIADDNVADALALAALGARWTGAPIDGASKARTAAVAAVVWPN